MSLNQDPGQAPIYQDISLLENLEDSDEFLTRVRAKMLTREAGDYQMVVERVQVRFKKIANEPIR